jgi:hypothetical protein
MHTRGTPIAVPKALLTQPETLGMRHLQPLARHKPPARGHDDPEQLVHALLAQVPQDERVAAGAVVDAAGAGREVAQGALPAGAEVGLAVGTGGGWLEDLGAAGPGLEADGSGDALVVRAVVLSALGLGAEDEVALGAVARPRTHAKGDAYRATLVSACLLEKKALVVEC